MSEHSAQRPPPFRIGTLRGFLPLSDNTSSVSTRGQTLPSLIQNRSSGNLKDLRAQLAPRRSRSVTPEVDSEDESLLERHENGELGRSWDGPSPAKSRLGRSERRMSTLSNGSSVLMTPQMRSMRLIGNSNPRYEWYARKTMCKDEIRTGYYG